MKTTIVIYGSSTGTCESVAQSIAAKLGVQAMNVQDMTAILVTEYAVDRRRAGMSLIQSAVGAAKARFRPIL